MVRTRVFYKRCKGIGMCYFDPTTIDAMTRVRLSHRGQLINLNMNVKYVIVDHIAGDYMGVPITRCFFVGHPEKACDGIVSKTSGI